MAMTRSSFDGLRVISFQSRRAGEMRRLIEKQGGIATVVATLREVPLEDTSHVLQFGRLLRAGEVDAAVFMTAAGTRIVARLLQDTPAFRLSLTDVLVVARSPQTARALRESQLAANAVVAPSPHTWREVLTALKTAPAPRPPSPRPHLIAIQESGWPNRVLLRQLEAQGSNVVRVPVYRWTLPQEPGPLSRAINDIIEARFDIALFTTGTQVWHLFKTAYKTGVEDELRAALRRMAIASIGPSTSLTLDEFDLRVDIEASRATMRCLVEEAAAQSHSLIQSRRVLSLLE